MEAFVCQRPISMVSFQWGYWMLSAWEYLHDGQPKNSNCSLCCGGIRWKPLFGQQKVHFSIVVLDGGPDVRMFM